MKCKCISLLMTMMIISVLASNLISASQDDLRELNCIDASFELIEDKNADIFLNIDLDKALLCDERSMGLEISDISHFELSMVDSQGYIYLLSPEVIGNHIVSELSTTDNIRSIDIVIVTMDRDRINYSYVAKGIKEESDKTIYENIEDLRNSNIIKSTIVSANELENKLEVSKDTNSIEAFSEVGLNYPRSSFDTTVKSEMDFIRINIGFPFIYRQDYPVPKLLIESEDGIMYELFPDVYENYLTADFPEKIKLKDVELVIFDGKDYNKITGIDNYIDLLDEIGISEEQEKARIGKIDDIDDYNLNRQIILGIPDDRELKKKRADNIKRIRDASTSGQEGYDDEDAVRINLEDMAFELNGEVSRYETYLEVRKDNLIDAINDSIDLDAIGYEMDIINDSVFYIDELNLTRADIVFEDIGEIIDRIEINGLDVSDDIIKEDGMINLRIKELDERGFVRSYAIDPEGLMFTDAIVEIVAIGEELYKCKEWDYNNEVCFGEWVLFKDDLIPGQLYSFILTPDDPAFGEKIDVLNVQSYPTVGDYWTVGFVTYGNDDLTIKAVDDTSWSLDGYGKDLAFVEIRCGDSPVAYEWVDDTVLIKDYTCADISYERSRVLTSGPHHIEFTFGGKSIIASNKATDPYDNITQTYATSFLQNVNTPTAVNLTGESLKHTGYTHSTSTDTSRIYVNETDLYKVSYSCSFITTGANGRHIMQTWLRTNGAVNITPSKQSCYQRNISMDANRCSNSAVTLVNLTNGDYVELMADNIQGTAGVVRVNNDCSMYLQRVRNRVIQAYDRVGNLNFDGTIVTVNLTNITYADPVFELAQNNINVSEIGIYKIYYHVCSETTGQNSRLTTQTLLRQNGTVNISPSSSYSFIRETSNADRACEQGYLIRNLSIGDYIDMRHQKYAREGAGATVTRTNESWMMMEKIDDMMIMAYENTGGQNIADLANTPIALGVNYAVDKIFNHTAGTSTVGFNKSGIYEISYSLAWRDDGGNDGVVGCAYLRLNGSVSISPSRMCEYSEGDAQGLWNSVAANIIMNITQGDYIELMANSNGSGVQVMPASTWISAVKLDEVDIIPPDISMESPDDGFFNDSWPIVNITLNCSASDDENLYSISLYMTDNTNSSTSFSLNSTSLVGGNYNSSAWTKEFVIGNYTWGCVAVDATGNERWSSNRSFSVNYTDNIIPVFDPIPVDQNIEYGDNFLYDVNATDNLELYGYAINDSGFNINQEGTITNATLLDVRIYVLNITAIDTWGNVAYAIIDVDVTDTVNPIFTYIVNVTNTLGVALPVQFDAYDLSGILSWSVNDTTNFDIDNTGLLTNNTGLLEIEYYLRITIEDNNGNTNSSDILVNITATPDTNPPWFDPIPTDQISEYNNPFSYMVYAFDDYFINTYWVNDSRFKINQFGLIENNTFLDVGDYYINISVNDLADNRNSSNIKITVKDTTPPTFTYISNLIIPHGIMLEEDFNVIDSSGISSWWINDTRFSIDNEGILKNNTYLDLGIYYLNITAIDIYSNLVNETITVEVIDMLSPEFFPSLINQSVEYGNFLYYDIDAVDSIGVDSFTVNDTVNFKIDSLGVLENNTFLAIGEYSLEIKVNDTSGNENIGYIIVNVSDTTSPSFTYIDNISAEYYSDIAVQFTAYDVSSTISWSEDSPFFSISNDGIFTNTIQPPIGNHTVNIMVSDASGNTVSRMINVDISEYTGRTGWTVQQGETRIQGSRTYVDLNSTRKDHAFIRITMSASAAFDDPDKVGMWAEFVNATRFVINRNASTANANYVGWQVIENPLINVQHYNVSFNAGTAVINHALTNSVNTSNTVVFVEYAISNNTLPAQFPESVFAGYATNATNVRLQRDMSTTFGGIVGFSVVEFNDGSVVQTGEVANVGSLVAPSVINLTTPINLTESWIYFSHASNSVANGMDDFGIIVKKFNSTTFNASREAVGGVKRMRWYVINTPGAKVQSGTIGPAGITTGYYPAAKLTPVVKNKTALLVSIYNSGATTTFSNYYTETYLYNTTHFYVRREVVAGTHNIEYQAIEFPSYDVRWNLSSLNMGTIGFNVSDRKSNASINSSGLNTDVSVVCENGNCSRIISDFTSGISLYDGERKDVMFTCKSDMIGNFSANFSVSSPQAPLKENIIVNCSVVIDLSYNIFYGNATGEKKIGINQSVMFNFGEIDIVNVYASDVDCIYNFSDLQSLGRKKDGTASTDDFIELDRILKMENKTDSIVRLYGDISDQDSTPAMTRNFFVNGILLENVPIINNSISSDYYTGILWDMNDSVDQEFDYAEKEDVIFISFYNMSAVGINPGSYGYEIKVPASLVNYTGTVSLIDFRLELD